MCCNMETRTVTHAAFELRQAGQSPWLDFISREILNSGELESLIKEKGLLGVTSNPSIFEKAISNPGGGYDQDIKKLLRKGASTLEIYDALTIADIQAACDLFRGVFKESNGEHGFVSLEVLPNLAQQTDATLAEALRLFKRVHRPNVMIKIPATPEGIPAIRRAIASGVNVNITLMFSVKHYRDVAQAYLAGLKDCAARGGDLSRIHSVASIFVSRIDTLLDKQWDALTRETQDSSKRAEIESLKGKAAIANSKVIYQEFKKIFGSAEFHGLQAKGATVQKVLWGSTSTKNPAYSDLMYVETLIGPETVNTMPQPTLEAFLDHGEVRPRTIEEGWEEAKGDLQKLKSLGFDMIEVGERLQREGVKAFSDSLDALMRTLEGVRGRKKKTPEVQKTTFSFHAGSSSEIDQRIKNTLTRLDKERFRERFLQSDPSLWKEDKKHQKIIGNRLGWLRAHEWMSGKLYEIEQLCAEVKKDKIQDVVLLGMGGSSMAAEVMGLLFKRPRKNPRLFVLDIVDPQSILKAEKAVRLKSALFIVAGKSGSTIETLSLFHYFYGRVAKVYGKRVDLAVIGRHFMTITDAGSFLEGLARERHFRKILINPSDIGGRYSALSFFGMAPSALQGFDVREILRHAQTLFSLFEMSSSAIDSPIALGVLLAELAKTGKDKLMILSSRSLTSFPAWLEQLIAESTGKEGKGIVPVEGDVASQAPSGGTDRVFVVIKLKRDPVSALMKKVKELKKAGFPVLEMEWPNASAIGAEFLRWEIATTVAGALLGINPFDEPNVKESKDNTARLLHKYRRKGRLEASQALIPASGQMPFEAFFKKLPEKAYVALLSYTERSPEVRKGFAVIRQRIQKRFGVPVLLGFGPRYLHSIGQLYKGGAREGLFIEFFMQEKKDIPIPGAGYSFGVLKRAQALGDLEALVSKGLPVLAVELGKDWKRALKVFEGKLTSFLRP